MSTMFELEDFVRKEGGDFSFEGYVIAVCKKRHSGEIRYVVEDMNRSADHALMARFKGWTPEQITKFINEVLAS